MDDTLYKAILKTFSGKPAAELRRVLAEGDSGEWTEEAVAAAAEVLTSRGEPTVAVEMPEESVESAAVPQGPGVFPLSAIEIKRYQLKIKFLGGAFCVLALYPVAIAGIALFVEKFSLFRLGIAAVALAVAVMMVVVGTGLIQLDQRSRVPGLWLAVVVMLVFLPMGSGIGLCAAAIGLCGILWLGKRGQAVMTSSTPKPPPQSNGPPTTGAAGG